jgi:hypothetical protein
MKSNSGMSLVALLKDNPNLMDRISEVAQEVKKDKVKIMAVADKYNQKYEKQISDGTLKRQIMITEGTKRGQTVEEVERNMGFIPSIYTPILNWLYFFMMEEEDPRKEQLRTEQEAQYRTLLHEDQNVQNMEKVPEAFVFLSGKVTYDQFQKLKKLKALSRSSNKHEAFSAYTKCMQLCEAFEVEFDKIPI